MLIQLIPDTEPKSNGVFSVGDTVAYDGARTGEIIDRSECGQFFLLQRGNIEQGEQARVAVLTTDVEEVM